MSLFLSLFDMYPKLLDLFPFKDSDGRPVVGELQVHGLKVVGTLGEVVHKLNNKDVFTRWVGGGQWGQAMAG